MKVGQNVWRDKISSETKHMKGQNVLRDKMFRGTEHQEVQNVWGGTKCPLVVFLMSIIKKN
jgi:hypothetical protein